MIKPILFKPLPDELMASYLSRLARINGYRDQREICTILAPKGRHTSFIDFPINFTEICDVTKEFLGDTTALIETCTWLPTQLRLGEIELSTLQSVSTGQIAITLSELSFIGHPRLKLCRTCVQADRDIHRVSYWHRIHQVPFVKICPEHETPLDEIGFRRSALHVGIPLPHEIPGKTPGRVLNGSRDSLNELAVTAWHAISSGKKIHETEVVSAIRDELEDRHYLRKNGSFKEKEFWGDFQSALINVYFATPQETAASRKIWIPVEERPSRPLPLGRVLLIHFLFGSWDHLLERIEWVRTFGSKAQFLNTRVGVASNPEGLAKLCREQLLDFVHAGPEGDRLAFTRRHYRAFRWLLRYDKAMLDQLLPIPTARHRQLKLFETMDAGLNRQQLDGTAGEAVARAP